MFDEIRSHKGLQLVIGLLTGIFFGFFLQRGGATSYNVILGQLLLKDFTVIKIMLTAVVVGMAGIYFMSGRNYVSLHIKEGSAGKTVVGGLIFGAGFAILGYCPGTLAGAIGKGSLDALTGGLPGILVGTWFFTFVYPEVKSKIYPKGYFGYITFPELFDQETYKVVIYFAVGIVLFLLLLEIIGL